MSFIKNIFSLNPKYYVLYLLGAISIILIVFPCFGVETGHSEPIFSLSINNQSLKQAINNISKSTDYNITVTREWENIPLTANLKNVALEEGLKKIIKLIGNPNYAIVKNNETKQIDIKILSPRSSSSSAVIAGEAELQAKQTEAVLNLDVPPTEQNEGITENPNTPIDPLDSEVIPPEKEGEKGITERELMATKTEKEEPEPSEEELIPPD
jgi:hypothetical protein